MAHTEFGFQVVNKFIDDIAPYGHPDFPAKLIGKGINVMISPLPRNKRAKHPSQTGTGAAAENAVPGEGVEDASHTRPSPVAVDRDQRSRNDAKPTEEGFGNNPFAQLEIKGS